MTMQEKEFYRVKEICAHLNISRTALWKRIKTGKAPQLEKKNPRVAGYSRATLRGVMEG
jgi:predicted DNA-binding transcriptional regulator AlpA